MKSPFDIAQEKFYMENHLDYLNRTVKNLIKYGGEDSFEVYQTYKEIEELEEAIKKLG